MKTKLTAKQAGITLDLLSHKHFKEVGFKRMECFKYGDRIFDGQYEAVVNAFVKCNPTGGDFYVWLQDHVRQLNFINY
jgi:hypothetical protein